MKKEILLRKPFLFLWLAQIASQLAFNMMNFVLILFVFEKTSSNTAVSGIIISFTLPALFFGMLAGIYVDQRNKKSILLATNLSRGILTILFFFTRESLGLVFVLAFLVSSATQFFIPAEASSIPRIITKKLLISANSLFAITLNGSILLGYVLAGPLLKIFGFGNTFLFAGMLYLLAAFFVFLLPPIGIEKKITLGDFFTNNSVERAIIKIREIYGLLRRVKEILFAIIFLTLSQGIILVLATLLPGYATTVLGIEATDISLVILAPATLGMVLGSILLMRFWKKLSGKVLVNAGIIVSGIIILILPLISRFTSKYFILSLNQYLPGILEIDVVHVVIALLFIAGLANSLIVVISNATIQGSAKRQFIGRTYGIVIMLSAAFSLFPVILAGGLADIFGVKTVLMTLGSLLILLGLGKVYKDYVF